MKNSISFLLFFLITIMVAATQEVVLSYEGQRFFLHDDKTWESLDENDILIHLDAPSITYLIRNDHTWTEVQLLANGKIIPFNRENEAFFSAPKIGVAIYKFDDTFMSYVRNAITENAADKVEVVDSQNAQPTQNDQVDAFLSKKMKAIAINPVDRYAAAFIIEKAKAKKTPVVFFNREPMPEDMYSWDKVYYVGAKAEQSGTMQGQIVVDYWKANPAADKNGDGKIQYIMLKGEPGQLDAELRTQYSIKAVTDAGIQVDKLAEDTAMWDSPKAFEKMKAFLTAYGDKIEVVFCNNDDMALGAIEVLKAEGYFTGEKRIVVVGADATAPALQAVEDGTLLGTVLNDAKNQGKATFDLAYALAKGTDVTKAGWTISDEKYVWVPYQKVTKDNYTQFK